MAMAMRACSGTQEVELDVAYLQSQRIVAFDGNDLRSRSFDMLRTEILQSMDLRVGKLWLLRRPHRVAEKL